MDTSNTPESYTERPLRSAANILKSQWQLLFIFVALFWGLEIVDWMTGHALDNLGIQPRSTVGLRGILFAPFLHFGFEHVAANTIPFLVLGWFVLLRGFRDFAVTTLYTMLIGGLGIWIVGAENSIHLGASILIFGYLGYLLLSGLLERSLQSITLTLLAVMLYGYLIWGVLPLQLGVSWEGHLFGLIGGGVAARQMVRTPSPHELT